MITTVHPSAQSSSQSSGWGMTEPRLDDKLLLEGLLFIVKEFCISNSFASRSLELSDFHLVWKNGIASTLLYQ